LNKCNSHADHRDEVPRINRVEGQIRGIKKMVDEQKYCLDILTQIKAARSALKSLELIILENHIGHCLVNAAKSGSEKEINIKMNEVMELLKKSSKS